MQDQIKQLQEIGLTELEARVYLYFLESGPSKVTEVYKSLKTDKSSTYRVVENLSNQGLLVGLGEVYGQQFMVSDPNLLIEMVKSKQRNIKVASNAISKMISDLTTNLAEEYKKHNITVLEGKDAFFAIMEKRLEVGESPIREMDNTMLLQEVQEAYIQYIPDYIERRKKRKLFLKSIRPYKDHKRRTVKLIPGSFKDIRVLPKGIKIDAFLTTFGDYTAIHNLKGKRILGIIIKDPAITGVVNTMFDLVWEVL
jgi:sugar-specific transcriptional regulator TrmB